MFEKKLLFTLLAVGGCLLLEAAPIRMSIQVVPAKRNAGVELQAKNGKGLLKASNFTWGPEEMRSQSLAVVSKAEDHFKTYKIAFTPAADGKVMITWIGARTKTGVGEDGKPTFKDVFVEVKNPQVNGKLLPNGDFKKLDKKGKPVGFRLSRESELTSDGSAIKVGHNARAYYILDVEAGKTYEISTDARQAE